MPTNNNFNKTPTMTLPHAWEGSSTLNPKCATIDADNGSFTISTVFCYDLRKQDELVLHNEFFHIKL